MFQKAHMSKARWSFKRAQGRGYGKFRLGRRAHLSCPARHGDPGDLHVDLSSRAVNQRPCFVFQDERVPRRWVIGFRYRRVILSPAAPTATLNCETCIAKARCDRRAESTKRDMIFFGGESRVDLHALALPKLVPF